MEEKAIGQHAVERFQVAAGGVIKLDQFAAFGQGKADALAAQNQFQADLARELDITTRAIRFYEEQGLLEIGRAHV